MSTCGNSNYENMKPILGNNGERLKHFTIPFFFFLFFTIHMFSEEKERHFTHLNLRKHWINHWRQRICAKSPIAGLSNIFPYTCIYI